MKRHRRAFTLIELLAVLAIIGILVVFTAPALSSIFNASGLADAGQLVGDEIKLARQEAVTRNRDVQVRFYYLNSGPVAGWRGIQVWRVEQTSAGVDYVPVSKFSLLPANMIISDPDNTTFSPLLNADSTVAGNGPAGALGNVPYRGFSFSANGSPEDAVSDANDYLTIQSAQAQGSPPKNYYTLQIDPRTGKVTIFRP